MLSLVTQFLLVTQLYVGKVFVTFLIRQFVNV
jgi:hypothetical protein